jgi:hypothetical protein
LYSLFTYDCVALHDANSIIWFNVDARAAGLITNNNESPYWEEEVRELALWCQDKKLSQRKEKKKEMIVDFSEQRREHVPIHIKQDCSRESRQL